MYNVYACERVPCTTWGISSWKRLSLCVSYVTLLVKMYSAMCWHIWRSVTYQELFIGYHKNRNSVHLSDWTRRIDPTLVVAWFPGMRHVIEWNPFKNGEVLTCDNSFLLYLRWQEDKLLKGQYDFKCFGYWSEEPTGDAKNHNRQNKLCAWKALFWPVTKVMWI